MPLKFLPIAYAKYVESGSGLCLYHFMETMEGVGFPHIYVSRDNPKKRKGSMNG